MGSYLFCGIIKGQLINSKKELLLIQPVSSVKHVNSVNNLYLFWIAENKKKSVDAKTSFEVDVVKGELSVSSALPKSNLSETSHIDHVTNPNCTGNRA